MRSLVIVNHYAGLPNETSGIRHWSFARELMILSWEVEIIAADTLHPSGAKRSRETRISYRESTGKLNPVFTLINTPAYRKRGVGRFGNMTVFFLNSLNYLIRRKKSADIVIGSTVHPLAPLAALIYCKWKRVPFVFEIRDLWPETLIAFGVLKRNAIVTRFMFLLERLLWNHSQGVISPLMGVPKYGKERGYRTKPFLHLPNCANTFEIPFRHPTKSTPRRLAYVGSMGIANNLNLMVDSIKTYNTRYPKSVLHFDFYGDGPLRNQLSRKVKSLDLNNVSFLGTIQRDKLFDSLAEYHGFILPFYDSSELYGYGASPNKLADYLALGRPVLIGHNFPGNPIRNGINGFILENSIESWVEYLRYFAELEYEKLLEMSKTARLTAEEELSFKDSAKDLDEFLVNLVEYKNGC